MPSSCIAPGCNERYGPKKSNLSFFSCPKDPIRKAKWQHAIPRLSFELKSGHSLCEKHFSPDDIIRNKIVKDTEGKIILEINFKTPRLAEDAVPTSFLNRPGEPSNEFLSKTTPRHPSDTVETINPDIKLEEPLSIPENDTKCNFNQSNFPSKCTLELLFNNLNATLPLFWSRVIPTSGPKAVFFTQIISCPLADGKLSACIFKEISVDDSGILTCRVLGKTIDNAVFNISDVSLKDFSYLSEIISKVDSAKVCKGNVMDGELSVHISSEVCEMDQAGNWRHRNCPLIIPSVGVCDNCKRARKTLLQKQLRDKRRTCIKRLTGQLSPTVEKVIYALNKANRNYRRRLVRAKSKIKSLKAKVKKMEEGKFLEKLHL